jgi:hypothetical protein
MQYAFQFAICQGEGFFRWEGAPAHLRFENKRLISRMQLLWAWPKMLLMRRYRMLVLIVALAFNVSGQSAPDKRLEFLLGKWVGVAGEKDTPLGPGQGAFSFEAQLNQKIIVRHNHAGYNSGTQHDDLMVIYFDAPNSSPRAMYFDTEGHVIRYNLTFPSANAVVFESDGTQPGPRYRLTYQLERDALNGRFEIAPPGGEYKAYMHWTSKRS